MIQIQFRALKTLPIIDRVLSRAIVLHRGMEKVFSSSQQSQKDLKVEELNQFYNPQRKMKMNQTNHYRTTRPTITKKTKEQALPLPSRKA